MPRRYVFFLSLAAALLGQPRPADAHHTFVTKYDPTKLVTISGAVSSVSYVNPHIHFEVDAAGASWTVETESISVASARGLSQAILKQGAKVTVTGWRARDGSAAMGLHSIAFQGGGTIVLRRTAR
jgi:hypothetical protein